MKWNNRSTCLSIRLFTAKNKELLIVDTIAYKDLPALFQSVSRVFERKKNILSNLDAKMGDGDLGITMSRGYAIFPSLLQKNLQEDVGKTLIMAAVEMLSVVPSTMGTLMASGIMEGGKALRGKKEINAVGLYDYLKGFETGIQKRGKCKKGDRTILDSIACAVNKVTILLSMNSKACLADVIEEAVQGAKEGVEATKSMLPVFGKAAIFASTAIGLPDQGAVSGLYMLIGMQNYICK